MKQQLVSFFSITTSYFLVFLIALLISLVFSTQKTSINVDELLKIYSVSPGFFAPEPQERWIYITNTLLAPLFCGSFYLLFSKMIQGEKAAKVKMLYWTILPAFLFLLGYLVHLDLKVASFKYVQMSGFIQHPWATLIVNVGFIVFLLKKHKYKKILDKFRIEKIGTALYFGLGSFILILIGLETVFNESEPYVPHIHFIAYFDSIVQVFLGKHVLIDINPQYGAYASLLNPIFQMIGLNVLKLTLVMGILKIIIYGSFLFLLYRLLNNKFIAFLSFLTIFFYTRMRAPIEIITHTNFEYKPQAMNYPGLLDPYFQYNPHRMLFPALLLFFSWFYISAMDGRAKKSFYFINTFLSALATLWNPDTGLVVTVAWLGLLMYQEVLHFKQNKLFLSFLFMLRHIFMLLIAYATVYGGFTALTYLETGLLPNFSSSAAYTQLFYFSGYFMLLMPVIHPWNMVILVYLIGIYFSIRDLIRANQLNRLTDKTQHQNRFIFLASIMGVGLFNYYLGRSHDYNLIATVWPAYFLLAIFTDKLLQRVAPIFKSTAFNWKIKTAIVSKNYLQAGFFVALIYFLGSSLISVAGNMPAYLSLINARMIPIQKGTPAELDSLVEFIEKTHTEDESIFVISDYAPELYLSTKHVRPIDINGFGEIILCEEIEKIRTYLANPPENGKIYWDNRFYAINSFAYNIDPYEFPNLVPVEVSQDNNVVLFSTR